MENERWRAEFARLGAAVTRILPGMDEQFLFDFQASPKTEDSLSLWRELRAREVQKACHRIGLPVGRNAEVRLKSGTTFRGLLRLAEETLWIEADRKTVILQVAEATFHISEIAAAVRADGCESGA
jgi:hypothetical protein